MSRSSSSQPIPQDFGDKHRNRLRGFNRRQINELLAKYDPRLIAQFAEHGIVENTTSDSKQAIWTVTEDGYELLAGTPIAYEPLDFTVVRAIIEKEIGYQVHTHRGMPIITSPEPDTFRAEWKGFHRSDCPSIPQEMVLEAARDHKGWALHFWYGYLSESCRYQLEMRFVGDYLPESDIRMPHRRCPSCNALGLHHVTMVATMDEAYERLRGRVSYYA